MQDFEIKQYTAPLMKGSLVILVGDIGGTNSNFGFFDIQFPAQLALSAHIKSRLVKNYTHTITELVSYVETTYGVHIVIACLGVAGVHRPAAPRILPTHLPTAVNSLEISHMLQIPVALCNDFELVVWGSSILTPGQYHVVREGTSVPHGTRVYIGAGTGLGHAIGVWDSHLDQYEAVPTEGGHVDFAPENEFDWEFVKFLKKQYDTHKISWERVLSGAGLADLYTFLGFRYTFQKSLLTELLAHEPFQPDFITAYEALDEQCATTYKLYQRFYASYGRNSILHAASYGGLYIAGGIAARNPSLYNETFLAYLTEGAVHHHLLSSAPVTLITDYNVSLYGGAVHASQLISSDQ